MWCETQARSPRARQNVFLSSAPQASNGTGVPRPGTGRLAGTYPRDRRTGTAAGPGRGDHADHRVIGAGLDRAVVAEHDVGDRSEPRERVVVAERDRLVGHVAAREHERVDAEHRQIRQQHVVQRRVGQHQAQLACPRRH